MNYHTLAGVEYTTGWLYPGWDEYRFRGVVVLVFALLDGLFLQHTGDEDRTCVQSSAGWDV